MMQLGNVQQLKAFSPTHIVLKELKVRQRERCNQLARLVQYHSSSVQALPCLQQCEHEHTILSSAAVC